MEKRKKRIETDRGRKEKREEERVLQSQDRGVVPNFRCSLNTTSALNHTIPPLALLPCCPVLHYSLITAKPWVKMTLRQKG